MQNKTKLKDTIKKIICVKLCIGAELEIETLGVMGRVKSIIIGSNNSVTYKIRYKINGKFSTLTISEKDMELNTELIDKTDEESNGFFLVGSN